MHATCSSCRWWETIDPESDGTLNGMVRNAGEELDFFDDYDWTEEQVKRAEEIRARVRRCKSPKLLFFVLPQDGEAAVVDGSGYRAELCTDQNFGCSNHTPLPEEQENRT